MRLLPLLGLLLAGCSSMKPASNSRAQEQARLNAVTGSGGESGLDRIMRPDPAKTFDPGSANFGRTRPFATKGALTNEFHFEDRTRTKSFATRDFTTGEARLEKGGFDTKAVPTKESWFSGLTARSKDYPTKESRDAGKTTETRALPGADRTYTPRGRRQASLDKNGGAAQPVGAESWSGELKPLTIQDVKALLNRN
jgi:hypothetical protein